MLFVVHDGRPANPMNSKSVGSVGDVQANNTGNRTNTNVYPVMNECFAVRISSLGLVTYSFWSLMLSRGQP